MNLAPFFATQFFDSDGDPLSGGLLYTYDSGTTDAQTTYEDQAGATPNTNPIVLDAAGRCDLWLDPTLEYTLLLKTAGGVTVDSWDDVVGAASGSGLVTSVQGLTGDVSLTADDIPFTTGTSTDWFSGADVSAALDNIIVRIGTIEGSGGIAASTVSISDAGGYYTSANVEGALQELGVYLTDLGPMEDELPSQSGHNGKYLKTNGTAVSWETVATAALPAFTVTIDGGDISLPSLAFGSASYGGRSASVSGGSSPFRYHWSITTSTPAQCYVASGAATASATFEGTGDGDTNTASICCFVTDSTGRVTSAQIALSATHAASGA